jgi:hypothetical protein
VPERTNIINQVEQAAQDIFRKRTMGAVQPPGGVWEPWQVKIIKQDARSASEEYQNAKDAGTVAAGDPGLMSSMEEGARKNLATIPGWSEAALQTKKMIGLNQAAINRQNQMNVFSRLGARGAPAAAAAGIGFYGGHTPQERIARGLGGFGIGSLLGSQAFLSPLALTLGSPLLSALLQYAPQLAGPAVGDQFNPQPPPGVPPLAPGPQP